MSTQWHLWDAAVEQDRRRWIELWSSSPMQHPFAHPEVCQLLKPEHGRLMAASFTHGHGHVLYPFFLRDIQDAVPPGADAVAGKDITSPYGYGGPLHWGLDDVEASAPLFWNEFDSWAQSEGVVSEFVRFSLFSDEVLPYPGPTRTRQTNYVRNVDAPTDELWHGVESKVRRNARRALREGVSIVIDERGEHLDDFLRIYLGTMDRRDSADWYRFDHAFFVSLHRALPGRFAYVMAQFDGEIVSADLLLLGADTGYYFLGGTEATAFSARPNDLVKVEAMNWLRGTGRSRYVLGGGVQPQDGLERYKRGFAPRGAVAFSTGERVLCSQRYVSLVEGARQRFLSSGAVWEESDEFFPAYRRPMPAPVPTLQRVGGVTP